MSEAIIPSLPIRTIVKLYKNLKPLAPNKIFSQTLGKSAFVDNTWLDEHTPPVKCKGAGGSIDLKQAKPKLMLPTGSIVNAKPGDSITLTNCRPHSLINLSSGQIGISQNDGSYRILSVTSEYIEYLHPRAQYEEDNSKIAWVIRGNEEGDPRPMHEEFWLVDIVKETSKGEKKGCFLLKPVKQVQPSEFGRLLPGMYDEVVSKEGCLFIVPKPDNRNALWIFPLLLKQSINTQYYAMIVVLG
jgi:hypothetical protein